MRFILWGWSQWEALDDYLIKNWQDAAEAKKPLVVTISEFEATRRSKQNDRYWAVLRGFVDYAASQGKAYNLDVWHEYFKREFIGVVELPNGGLMGKSSAGLTVSEFADFSTAVEAWMATEMGYTFNG